MSDPLEGLKAGLLRGIEELETAQARQRRQFARLVCRDAWHGGALGRSSSGRAQWRAPGRLPPL